MKKRALVALLWFYTGWYAWNLIAFQLGLTELIGPAIGAAAAALFAGDPRQLIWKRPVASLA
jgi:hypothetical protein